MQQAGTFVETVERSSAAPAPLAKIASVGSAALARSTAPARRHGGEAVQPIPSLGLGRRAPSLIDQALSKACTALAEKLDDRQLLLSALGVNFAFWAGALYLLSLV